MVPGVTEPQQFVGYRNMQKFVARIVPTFKDEVNQVVITGASAGDIKQVALCVRLQGLRLRG